MSTELLVSRTGSEVRVALVQGGRTVQVQVERERERSIVGNLYKGRVVRVVPGMQAAFVDIGLDRAAFLYVGDVRVPAAHEDVESTDINTRPDELDATHAGEPIAVWQPEPPEPLDPLAVTTADERLVEFADPPTPPRPRIEQLLRVGQELVVQVSKAPLGTKGPRVTTQISMPGRFLVYLAGATHVGVSRRIEQPVERERLRELVTRHRRPGEGFIVRTVCEGRDEDVLAEDIQFLRTRWTNIAQTIVRARSPSRIYEEPDVVLRAARDLLSPEVERMIVDDPDDYRRLTDFVARFLPTFKHRIEQHVAPSPIFERHDVEGAIERALQRTVRLPSGGSLVIEHTEALTSIDVNSGRYTGGANLAELTLRVNLEAARAVAEELRLRDIGGLIVVDFIDMDDPRSREQVHAAVTAALAGDPARSTVLPISDFGLMEMTRRRVKRNLARSLLDECGHCAGRGMEKSVDTVVYEVLREVGRQVALADPGRGLRVRCAQEVAERIVRIESSWLRSLEDRLGGPIRVAGEVGHPRTRFDVSFLPRSAG